MANWKHRCDIKQYVHDDDLSTHEVVEKIAWEISKCRAFDDTLFAEYFTEILDLDEDELENEADGFLAQVYDYADANLIWMGP